MRFVWDKTKAAEVEAARGIRLSDAKEVFYDPRALDFYDESHSANEDRYIVTGLSGKGLLTVSYTIRERDGEEIYRLITAWHATKDETRRYEEN